MTTLTDTELESLLSDLESDRAERKEAWAGDAPEKGCQAEVRKPIFHLTTADGAIGSHSYAVTDARKDFMALAQTILGRIGWPA